MRAPQFDLAEAHLHLRPPRRAARLSGHLQLETAGNRKPVARGKQRIAVGQRAVLRRACEQVQPGRTRPRPALVNVGLAVTDHGDQFSSGQHRFGCCDPVLPALRFLGRHRPLAACCRNLATTHPQLGPGQPETAPAIGRDRQQRVQKQPLVGAVADRTQAVRAPGMALEPARDGSLRPADRPARRHPGSAPPGSPDHCAESGRA